MHWSSHSKQALLVVVGAAIGANGLAVAASPGRIPATYGVVVGGPDDAVLLRHRAVMLALIGATLAASAVRRELRSAAIPAAALSMTAFTAFALTAQVNDRQRRVAIADAVLLVLLGAAAVMPEGAGPAPAQSDVG